MCVWVCFFFFERQRTGCVFSPFKSHCEKTEETNFRGELVNLRLHVVDKYLNNKEHLVAEGTN